MSIAVDPWGNDHVSRKETHHKFTIVRENVSSPLCQMRSELKEKIKIISFVNPFPNHEITYLPSLLFNKLSYLFLIFNEVVRCINIVKLVHFVNYSVYENFKLIQLQVSL